jgi:hypothetical protein
MGRELFSTRLKSFKMNENREGENGSWQAAVKTNGGFLQEIRKVTELSASR